MTVSPLRWLLPLLTALALGFATLPGVAEASPISPAPAEVRVAAALEVEVDGPRTRLKVTLSHPVAATAQVLERPDRVVIDFPEVAFHLPPDAGRKREGLINSYRYGLFAPGRSRMVVDLAQPAIVSRIETVPNARDGSTLLIVELARTDREEFRRAAAESATRLAAPAAEPASAETGDRRPVIMLDPGHGGVDPGAAASGGVVEKDIVFAFAQLFKQKLEAGGRYRVLMTRNQDVFVPLGERVRIAQRAKADLFISVHADSIAGGQQDVRGLTVYTGAERASDADSARLADRENQADAVAGLDPGEHAAEDVSDILRDLTARETRAFSHTFAGRLVGELDTVARLNKNPHRQAGFRVLRAYDVPSVLVELGYLSSRKDADLLMSNEWRERSTTAMASAVDRFFAKRQALRPTLP